jgi:ceroid-lipofuscinosis protein 6
MGASIHLVGDSIQHRLIHSGYKLHLSVRDNPIIQAMQPSSLVHTFELIYFYDEQLGHELWYIPLYIAYTLYFSGCFLPPDLSRAGLGVGGWTLVLLSAGFESYLVTEGQIFPLFFLTLVAMVILLLWRWREGVVMDSNAVFLLARSVVTLCVVGVWVWWLWTDPHLRRKYPGWLYVPEPWSYVSLYVMKM